MAKSTMMGWYEIVLLLLLSSSATMVLYVGYSQYKRVQHLRRVKDVVFTRKTEMEMLLEKEQQHEDISLSGLQKVRTVLQLAGVKLPLWAFFSFVVLFVLAIDASFVLFLRHWAGFIIGTPLGILLVYMFVKMLIRRRKQAFNRALSIAISVLVKMMKNGIGFEQALAKSIAVSSSKLLKEIFGNFFQEKNTVGEIQAFRNMYGYVDSKELKIFALAIKIGRQSGGQFSNTLEKVEKTINYRKKMQEKVDVLTREGSFGSYVVVGIAILLYFMLNSNFDGKIHDYFMNSEYGRFQLLGIGIWVFIGILTNNFITRIER